MKIVQVVNAMIDNRNKISNVIKRKKEYFFLYNEKHKWSISQTDDGAFFLFLYPNIKLSLEELSNLREFDWDNLDFITYSTSELKATEALESFSELYQVVSGKAYGIDQIFDEILNE